MRRITFFTQKGSSSIHSFLVWVFSHLPARMQVVARRYKGTPMKIALGVLISFILLITIRIIVSNTSPIDTVSTIRSVVLSQAGISVLAKNGVDVTGEVQSHIKGDLRSQSTGIITAVYHTVSEHVASGTIIAIVENAQERAGVAQAQAGVAQAQASYDKVSGGTRKQQLSILNTTTKRASEALKEAYINTRNTLLNAYATTDTSFTGGVDSLFIDPTGPNPRLAFISSQGSESIKTEHLRFISQSTIEREKRMSQTIYSLSDDALIQELNTTEQDIRALKEITDALIFSLDYSIASASVSTATLSQYKTIAITARTSLLTVISSISKARNALASAQSAFTISKENEALGVAGSQNEDIAFSVAQLDSAQATLAEARARLEKTYIRAPVAGIITRLNLKSGDFVSAYQDVGLVSNPGTLEIKTYVTSSLASKLSLGQSVRIADTYDGTIESIAQSIDPKQQQIEIRIAFSQTKNDVPIPDGTRVAISFVPKKEQLTHSNENIFIPIAALKLVGDKSFVFVVGDNNKLIAVPVVLGAVSQTNVEIKSGIESTTNIVLDARGFSEGDTVIAKIH